MAAQQTTLVPAPPMGWNSWDSYALTVTESQFKANASVLATRLKPFGWQYAVVDEGWYLANPDKATQSAKQDDPLKYTHDEYGRYTPAINRFPSAEGALGFKPLAESVHAQGLKFGIHIIRGIPREAATANLPIAGSSFKAQDAADTSDTCPWNPDNYGVKDNAAGQAWYDSLIAQYASWDIDYIKVDCIASHPYKETEIRMLHNAIVRTGKPIVLSLSPGPAPLDKAAPLAEYAQLWRISDDLWDHWEKGEGFSQGVKPQFALIAAWNPFVKPGTWPDADMLPIGHLGPMPGYGKERNTLLTHDEQTTLLTLWSISRSPLFVGANLTQLDDFTTSLLTNTDVLAISQHATTSHPVTFLNPPGSDLVAWVAKTSTSEYLAVFNIGDQPATVDSPLTTFGFKSSKYSARDLWLKKDLGHLSKLSTTLPPHGAILLKLQP